MRHDRHEYHRFNAVPYYSSERHPVHDRKSSSFLDYILPSVVCGLLYVASVVIFSL